MLIPEVYVFADPGLGHHYNLSHCGFDWHLLQELSHAGELPTADLLEALYGEGAREV